MPQHSEKKPPSQRQLRVGGEVRHAVSSILMRNEIHDPAFEKVSITVSEVRISPDLKNATVYVAPLAGQDKPEPLIERLNQASAAIRKIMNRHVALKYSPKLYFKLDKSFDSAGKILQILQSDRVREDVLKAQQQATAPDDES